MYCRNCKRDISVESFQLHEAHCSRNITLCEFCEEPVPLRQKEEHYQTLHQPIPCSLCGANVPRDAMSQHKEKYCTEQIVQCQYCNMGIRRGVFDTHVESCGSRTDICERCGQRVLFREMLEHSREACSHTSKNSVETAGRSFSNCPRDEDVDGAGEEVNGVDRAWQESLSAAMQAGAEDGDPDATLARKLFLEELSSSDFSMETDDVANRDERPDTSDEMGPTSSWSIRGDNHRMEQLTSDEVLARQLASDEEMARQLQEDEEELYHAIGDRHGGVFSEAKLPDEPKRSTSSEKSATNFQYERDHKDRSRISPKVTTPTDGRDHQKSRMPATATQSTNGFGSFRVHPFHRHSELFNWPFVGLQRDPFFRRAFGGFDECSFPTPFKDHTHRSSFPSFSRHTDSSTTPNSNQQLHSSHGNYYYVEEPDE